MNEGDNTREVELGLQIPWQSFDTHEEHVPAIRAIKIEFNGHVTVPNKYSQVDRWSVFNYTVRSSRYT